MAATKKAEATERKPDEFDAGAEKRRASKADMDFQAHRASEELDAQTARREAAAQGLINAQAKVKADPNGNIDQRMAALNKDHQKMGARP